jgi:hypothetical protein
LAGKVKRIFRFRQIHFLFFHSFHTAALHRTDLWRKGGGLCSPAAFESAHQTAMLAAILQIAAAKARLA